MNTEPLYRIKPLVWEEDTFPNGKHIDLQQRWTCWTAICRIVLEFTRAAGYDLSWSVHFVGTNPQRLKGAKTAEDAKIEAERLYRERLLSALEIATENAPVKTVTRG